MIPDADEIERFLLAAKRPGELFEVRAFAQADRMIFAGWFNAAPGVGSVVADKLKGLGPIEGAFFTPHRIKPDAISAHRIGVMARQTKRTGGTTRDEDIAERVYLLVDVDPVRAPGCEKMGATLAETMAAAELADKVKADLTEFFGRPLVVDSGNGFHLYFRLPAPEPGGPILDDDNDAITTILRLLADRYDNEHAKIDTTVRNASRVMKLPGTWTRKGDATDDRPHRIAKILEVPNDWVAG